MIYRPRLPELEPGHTHWGGNAAEFMAVAAVDRYCMVVEAFQEAERRLIDGQPTAAVEQYRTMLHLLAQVDQRFTRYA